jgi:hypothetical protein
MCGRTPCARAPSLAGPLRGTSPNVSPVRKKSSPLTQLHGRTSLGKVQLFSVPALQETAVAFITVT